MLEFFDSHAHYMDERFEEDRDELLKNLNNTGNVKYIMNASYDIKSSYEAVSLAKNYDFCYAAVGVHPHDSKDIVSEDYDKLKALSQNEKVMAIGETGLDYHYDNSERNVQREHFSNHLLLAKEVKLPVIIHEREATKDTLDIVCANDNTGVFHCFSGSVETARTVLNKGYYISFAGPVTFKNAVTAKEVAKYVPEDRFLIETDCPYLAPVPKRGERNTSFNLIHIAQEIAMLRGESVEKIVKLSVNNAKTLFDIKG